MCGDGSCRYDEKECSTKFECPLGYKVCGVKCILLNENCNDVNIECNDNEVLCWDLSCAEGYESCPTRITCPNNKVLCPDNTCQLSGHCIQPKNRKCNEGQYQCSDFSCVNSQDDCIKNIICEPGFSLCENKTCNKYCIGQNNDDNNDDENNNKNNAGLIGGLVGGLGGAAIIGGFLFYFLFWKKRKFLGKDNVDYDTGSQNIELVNKNIDNKNVNVYNKNNPISNNNEINNEHHDVEEMIDNNINDVNNIEVQKSTKGLRSIKNVN